MSNHIILSTCLLGSVFICATSITMINVTYLENKKIPRFLIIINGLTFIISGFIFLFCFNLFFKLLI
jgi:hypothetical protein